MKKLLFLLLIFIGCEKEPLQKPTDCWECLIKQSDGIEYACKYECTEAQLQAIISDLKSKGTIMNCEKREQ